MSHIITPDICDAHPEVQVLDPIFLNLGGREAFCGPVRTIKCFEDNTLLMQAVAEPGDGAVLVVDAGGSIRCALFGDRLAEQALENGWAGVVLYGCVRDVDVLAEMELGVQALGVHPRRSQRNGEGQRDLSVQLAGACIAPGQWLYADNNGIVIAEARLPLEA
ncbi:ribonuclease E activity regulator RraA [Halomonas sp. ML-15]|uniref:ribonuclease E activity regulator RraA n=1 Tax=Halomonas sp. ML-15 TaxID=2773305 RepID=UPI0017467FE5|nr:ribonuclease E activity regulator RraA [Halomonas sp. ML-15]MBD3895181.1 ribonuclease E activity regulator RraA [Halomonas sp. ML-15]